MPDRENKKRIVKFNQVKSDLFSHEALHRAPQDKDRDNKRSLHANKKFTNMHIFYLLHKYGDQRVSVCVCTQKTSALKDILVFFSSTMLVW